MNDKVKKYSRIIFSRIWILLVLAIVGAGAVYLTRDSVFEKKYEANMKIIITLRNMDVQSTSVFDSIRSSQMAAGDISQIIGSDTVLSSVEKECGVDRLTIGSALKIDIIPSTRILDIRVERNTPDGALKLIESLDKNLNIVLKEIDTSITYKILSKPHVNPVPVNQNYPVLFAVAAAFGGLILGALINLLLGDRTIPDEGLNQLHNLFKEENILLVPLSQIPKQDGGTL